MFHGTHNIWNPEMANLIYWPSGITYVWVRRMYPHDANCKNIQDITGEEKTGKRRQKALRGLRNQIRTPYLRMSTLKAVYFLHVS